MTAYEMKNLDVQVVQSGKKKTGVIQSQCYVLDKVYLFIDHIALAKQGDNELGSVHMSVCLSVCGYVCPSSPV